MQRQHNVSEVGAAPTSYIVTVPRSDLFIMSTATATETAMQTSKEEDHVPDHKHVDTLTVPIISAKQPLLYSANPLLIFSMVVFGCSTLLFGQSTRMHSPLRVWLLIKTMLCRLRQ
jgi:hypothetical protein